MPGSDRWSAPLPAMPPMTVLPHRRLWMLRMERRMSLAQLAYHAGVRAATLCDIERGTTQMPNLRTLSKIAAVYGMTLDTLCRQIGMVGPLHVVPVPPAEALEGRRFSVRAEQIAAVVDTLPDAEQRLIETVCAYLQARRHAAAPDTMMEVMP